MSNPFPIMTLVIAEEVSNKDVKDVDSVFKEIKPDMPFKRIT